MSTQYIVVCFFVFLAGFIDSIAGGGGLISLPAYYAVGIPPHMALGTNKFSSSFGTITSSFRFIKSKKVHYRTALFSIIFAFIGSGLGANLALFLDEKILQYVLVVALPIIAVLTLLNKNMENPKPKNFTKLQADILASVTGLVVGAYDGFFGPGTGMFLILIYTSVMGIDMVTASGNSKLVNLSSNLAAVFTFIISGNVLYSLAIPAAVCGIAGNWLGSGLAIKSGSKVIKPVLIIVMLLLLAKIATGLF